MKHKKLYLVTYEVHDSNYINKSKLLGEYEYYEYFFTDTDNRHEILVKIADLYGVDSSKSAGKVHDGYIHTDDYRTIFIQSIEEIPKKDQTAILSIGKKYFRIYEY